MPHPGANRRRLALPTLLLALAVAGCSPTTGSPTGPTPSSSQPTASPTAIATATPLPAAARLAACPAPRAESSLPVMAHLPGMPDDLAATPDGGLWVSDESQGRLTRLNADGTSAQVIRDPRGPEGVVPLPDGTLLLAEQTSDRIVVLRPPSALPSSTVVALKPVPGQAGLDSIALDAPRNRILIPDSAQGSLRAMPLGGGPVSTLAGGLGRPVDVAVGPDGFLYVASEGRPGLWRVPADGGPAAPVANQYFLDEVLVVGPLLYLTDLADGSVRAIDPGAGASRILVTGIAAPQGLAQLADGRLAISDSTRGLVIVLSPC